MKKIMILVSAIMMVATANAKRVETDSFNEVRVNVPARVRLVAGDTYSVNVMAENEVAAEAVRFSVKDGVLRINTRDMEALDVNASSLCITIVAPEVPKLTSGRELEIKVLRDSSAADKSLAKID